MSAHEDTHAIFNHSNVIQYHNSPLVSGMVSRNYPNNEKISKKDNAINESPFHH
jgi:hypothetical protein